MGQHLFENESCAAVSNDSQLSLSARARSSLHLSTLEARKQLLNRNILYYADKQIGLRTVTGPIKSRITDADETHIFDSPAC